MRLLKYIAGGILGMIAMVVAGAFVVGGPTLFIVLMLDGHWFYGLLAWICVWGIGSGAVAYAVEEL